MGMLEVVAMRRVNRETERETEATRAAVTRVNASANYAGTSRYRSKKDPGVFRLEHIAW